MAMASLLAMSLLWALPSSAPPAAAWAPPVVPNAARTRLWPSHHRAPLMASVPPPAVATDESVETLKHLTVSELKERLRSMGQKVTGNKSELIERLMQTHNNSDDATTSIIDADETNLDPSVEQLPEPLREALLRYSSSSATSSSPSVAPKLLPVQQQSYRIISEGQDAVLFSPTGTGKTLAYTLPLAARLWGWKHDGSLQHQKQAQKQRFVRQQNRNRNDSLSSQPVDPATPSILVVEPSRELARQVGKVWAKFHPTAAKNNKRQVVTVYGGVPMARHAAMLGSKTDVVIGTPGRIRELIREKYLSTAHLRSVVLDEADTLLNFKDNPEVEWLLEGMQNDYQLVLASATVNKRVEKFVGDVMELEVGEEGYVVVEGDDTDAIDSDDIAIDDGIELDPDDASSNVNTANGERSRPTVQHWSMAASAASRIGLTSDLIVTMSPRRGIIFAPSKAEVEAVAQELTERLSSANDVSVHVLHGDMVQAARGRTVNAFRADTDRMTRLLVATDVASRGLDLPAVDLVLQYGVPRKTGKEGTFDEELYIHRTGRAGRYGNTRTADAIMLYDRSQGEAATLAKLQEEMDRLHDIEIMTRPLPSPKEVMEASYERAVSRCVDFEERADGDGQSLVQYFADRLSQDLEASGDGKSEEKLVHRLAAAMAALSGLDGVVPPRSLLTADPRDRTIRVWTDTSDLSNPLSPPEVTKVVKALGSGKLGRITICKDGSAVFDLGAKKADRLLQNASDDDEFNRSRWHLEIPSSLE